MSTSERDRRAMELFQAVIELPDGSREEWLSRQTGGDAELRADVESLLAAHERTAGILDAPLFPDLAGPPPEDRIEATLREGLADRYEIQEELGRGGMAVVFLARESKHDRSVVIKALKPGIPWLEGPERFEREVQIAAKLSHPHILGLIDSGSVDDILYYVMPHVAGETLADRLERQGKFELEEARVLLEDIASALSYAHAMGVVHRDLKPANILLAGSHAYLMDFGIAKTLDTEGPQLTAAGHGLGTPRYMAPEQVAGAADVDHRADIYAWGLIAYELLVGEGARARGYTLVPDEAVERLMAVEPAVPPGLIRLIGQCVQPRVRRRLSDIDRVLLYFQSGDPSLGRGPSTGGSRRVPRVVGVGGTALVAILAGAFFFASRADPDPRVSDTPGPIAVAPFANETGDAMLAPLGNLAGDWIAQGLLQLGTLPVLPWPTVLEVARNAESDGTAADLVSYLSEETGATTVIAGAFYSFGDEIQFSASVTDAVTGEVLLALTPISGPRAAPQNVIRELRDRIIGGLALAADERLAGVLRSAEPPTIEAYRTFDRGQRLYLEQDYGSAGNEFAEAYRRDTTFVVALVYEATMRFNTGQHAATDSILRFLDIRRDRLGDYQENRLDFLRSLLDGDGERALRLGRRGLELGPGSRAAYNYAYQAVSLNRPAEALVALEGIDPDLGEIRGWAQYWTQLSHATHLVGQFDREYEAATRMRDRHPERRVATVLQARALASMGDEGALATLLEGISALPPRTYWSYAGALIVAGEELAAHGFESASSGYLERAIDWLQGQLGAEPGDRSNRYWLGTAYYDLGRFEEARRVFEGLAEEFPERVDYRGLAALAIGQIGDSDSALAILGEAPPYDPGEYMSYRARLESVIGDPDRAIDLFSEALDQRVTGLPWLHASARPDLWALEGHPRFSQLMARATEVP